jgi:hypothetical protein
VLPIDARRWVLADNRLIIVAASTITRRFLTYAFTSSLSLGSKGVSWYIMT